ncbi:NAD-binding protein [Streptomyces sp. PalvLS-984]|uniref:NAD-binding protein n=1 Tax=Streptomyces sp. PalvLS-984 TaxID=1839782 RepID=UPI000A997DF1
MRSRLGLSHQALYDVASTASGQCWPLSVNCPVPGPVPTSPANRAYRPGFAASLMAKVLGLAANARPRGRCARRTRTASRRVVRQIRRTRRRHWGLLRHRANRQGPERSGSG